uniref:Uncharacterized protein n=1 Tax=Caenorhabditis japonica TaxID=281687 RepID=A0A8R1EAG3_CAEJA
MQSDTDAITWKQEVERVAPQLKITLRQDAKDWRLHLEQMISMHKNLDEKVEDVSPYLDTVGSSDE